MSTIPAKTCKTCYSEIDSRAKKCPHCHTWQSILSFNHPLIAVFVALVPAVLFISIFPVFMSKMFDPGRDFQLYRDQIEVVQSEIKFGEDNCGPTVVVLGTVRNHSDVTWSDVQFEALFFDKDMKIVDAGQDKKYSSVFPLKGESAFVLSFRRQFPQEQYAHHKVRVLWAKDARARF